LDRWSCYHRIKELLLLLLLLLIIRSLEGDGEFYPVPKHHPMKAYRRPAVNIHTFSPDSALDGMSIQIYATAAIPTAKKT
jgi:hypothetical protein